MGERTGCEPLAVAVAIDPIADGGRLGCPAHDVRERDRTGDSTRSVDDQVAKERSLPSGVERLRSALALPLSREEPVVPLGLVGPEEVAIPVVQRGEPGRIPQLKWADHRRAHVVGRSGRPTTARGSPGWPG